MTEKHSIDKEGARRAFEVLRPRLDAQEQQRAITTDVQKAAIFAAATGRMVKQPEVRAQFAQLPAEHFDITHVDNLEQAALAVWYATVMHDSASVDASRGKIRPELAAQGMEVKERMLKVVHYHLGDRDEVAAELADIRHGQGYSDLAADLLRLARLYAQHEHALAVDRRHYRASDREEAEQLAYRIHAELGEGVDSQAKRWSEYIQRAWTFLLTTYDEVRAAGRFVYRHDDGDAKFPSLFSVGRNKPRSTASAPADQTEPPAEQVAAQPAA